MGIRGAGGAGAADAPVLILVALIVPPGQEEPLAAYRTERVLPPHVWERLREALEEALRDGEGPDGGG